MTSLAVQRPSRLQPRRIVVMLVISLTTLIGALCVRWGLDQMSKTPVPPPPVVEWTGADQVVRYQARLRANAEDTDAYALLGLAFLQQVRETGDASGYMRAEQAFNEALQRDPAQTDALVGLGVLALARHDFEAALVWGEQARRANPFRAEAIGLFVDAFVELGRYDEAITAAQEMVDLRPGVASYTRVSYVRELHGKIEGAIAAMTAAVEAAVPGTEEWLWTRVQLGQLYFNSGRWDEAVLCYNAALAQRPNYVHALAGLARVEGARGEIETAIHRYEAAVARLPLPEFLIPLGELYAASGQPEKAEEQYAWVRVIQQLNAAAGMDVDMEMALFDVEHGGDPAAALERARAVYARRPSVHAAAVLAWALYRNGFYEEAQRYSDASLRLGTQDALLHFHAGMIARALGDRAAAQAHLQQAIDINPGFSVRYAPQARTWLARNVRRGISSAPIWENLRFLSPRFHRQPIQF